MMSAPGALPWSGGDPADDTARFQALAERLYLAEIDRLRVLGSMLTGDPEAGDNLAHEVIVDALHRIRRDPGHLREPAWPYLRIALLHMVSKRRRQILREIVAITRLGSRRPTAEPQLTPASIDMMRALQSLPERQRACVVLHYWQQLSHKEIGDLLHIAPRTVEVHLRDARRHLQSCVHLEPPEAWRRPKR